MSATTTTDQPAPGADYLLLICSDEIPTEEKAQAMREHLPGWIDGAQARGVRFGHRLDASANAVTVKVRNGETLVSDGPFAETKELIGGFDIARCADLDDAIALASDHPVSWFHSVEVRPFSGGGDLDEQVSGLEQRAQANPERLYALMVCVDGIAEAPDVEERVGRESRAWGEALLADGRLLFGQPLAHARTATTVRVRDGQALLSDGPFAETKEFVAGIVVLDCDGIDEAVALAASHPIAAFHRVEVRRFLVDVPGDGAADEHEDGDGRSGR